MSDTLLLACKELIDDAKLGSVDIVFKDTCLEILAKAKQVLEPEQFEELSFYVTEKMKDRFVHKTERKVKHAGLAMP